MKEIIIDASNALLGRLASYAAKQSLLGHTVIIINCNEVVISGNRRSVIEHYQRVKKRGGSALNGPFFSRMPERIVKRTIRGMLPYKQGRGEAALDRIRCYNVTPIEYIESKKIKAGKEKPVHTLSLKEVSKEL